MSEIIKNLIMWAIVAFVLLSVFQNFSPNTQSSSEVPYSQFLQLAESGTIQTVVFEGNIIEWTRNGEQFVTYNPETDNTALIGILDRTGVLIEARPPDQQSFMMQLFISSFPILLLIGIWVYFMRQ